MKKYPVVLFFLVLFSAASVSISGQECQIGFWMFDNWFPTIPSKGCHASTPDKFNLTATSYYSYTGELYPIDWNFEIKDFPHDMTGCSDCWYNGCHLHDRVTDPSQFVIMKTSIGGIKLAQSTIYGNNIPVENEGRVLCDVAKPEASGSLYLLVKAGIPIGMRTALFRQMNDKWSDYDDNFIFTIVNLPYHVDGLVDLPAGNNYLKSSTVVHHTAGHQYYCRSAMINKLQSLADDIRKWYKDYFGYDIKISYNDLSLEYGGIFDADWECGNPGHKGHRKGKSVDLNTTICLTCDNPSTGCVNRASCDRYEIKDENNKIIESGYYKDKIHELARNYGLVEKHSECDSGKTDHNLIHLEWE